MRNFGKSSASSYDFVIVISSKTQAMENVLLAIESSTGLKGMLVMESGDNIKLLNIVRLMSISNVKPVTDLRADNKLYTKKRLKKDMVLGHGIKLSWPRGKSAKGANSKSKR
jgi:hypothetical protein